MRKVFLKTREVASEGQSNTERNRIFLKVKEKIDAERQEKVNHQKRVQEEKDKLEKEKVEANRLAEVQKVKDEADKAAAFEASKLAEKRAQAMNVLLEALNQQRQIRAK